ncbi:methyl-accepting chemotaxis protein [Methylocaldum sp.]|uniref:methyl-accepting chemotaxis protein n=1 Tax=Methylocaldum sp. TaxID=1969727 RepID=UPI002D493DEE|nr:methyl-accepting chemotaxis protein [Methylocaldum sp.]HYE38086.1 methyl-accepting chemotaxis protein [Methylocaldum sp.]
MTFKQKIFLSAIVSFLCVALITGLACWGLLVQSDSVAKLHLKIQALKSSAEADRLHHGLFGVVSRALLLDPNATSEEREAIPKALRENTEQLRQYVSSLSTYNLPEAAVRELDAVKPLLDLYEFDANLLVSKALSDAETHRNLPPDFLGTFREIETKLTALSGMIENAANEASAEADRSKEKTLTMLMAFGLATLVLSILSCIYLYRGVYLPLRKVADHFAAISRGTSDLTIRLNDQGRNEVASIAASFNRFAAKLQDTLHQLLECSEKITEESKHLLEVSDSARQGVQQQQGGIHHLVAAVEQITVAIQEVARTAHITAEAVQETNQETRDAKQTVDRATAAIDALASNMGKATEVVGTLEQQTERIGAVLDVIRHIADQTNLLALNAAIEAARAGESGRGFAVVAEEVRSLASKTQQSTAEIQATIEQLQAEAKSAVQAMEDGRNQMAVTVIEAGKAGEALARITEMIGQLTDMNTQVASAAEQQTAVVGDINRNIVAIGRICNSTAEGATRSAQAARDLSLTAGSMNRVTGLFKV